MLNKVKAVNSSSLASVIRYEYNIIQFHKPTLPYHILLIIQLQKISMQMKEGVVYQKLRNPMEEVERKGHRGGAGDNMH